MCPGAGDRIRDYFVTNWCGAVGAAISLECHGAFALYCHIGQRHLRSCLKAGGPNRTRSNEELMLLPSVWT
jgi:hypothetical protein